MLPHLLATLQGRDVFMRMLPAIRFQLRNVFESPQYLAAVALAAIGIAVVFAEGLLRFWGSDVGSLPSAAIGWMGNYESMYSYLWVYMLGFVIPTLGCLAAGDSFCRDLRSGRYATLATRMGRRTYLASFLLAAFIGCFVYVAAMIAASQIVELLVFPFDSSIDAFQIGFGSNAASMLKYTDYAARLPFGTLASLSPYLLNLAYLAYDAFYISALVMFAAALSLYLPKQSLLVLAFPMAFVIVATQIAPAKWNPLVNLTLTISRAEDLSLVGMFSVPLLVLAAAVLLAAVSEFLLKGDLR